MGMTGATQIAIPTLVRVKDGALDRLGVYLERSHHRKIALLVSQGLTPAIIDRVRHSLDEHAVDAGCWLEVSENGSSTPLACLPICRKELRRS